MREADGGGSLILFKRGGDSDMEMINLYVLFIYILFTYLIIVTAIAVVLFVTLIVTLSKLNNQKNTPLSGS